MLMPRQVQGGAARPQIAAEAGAGTATDTSADAVTDRESAGRADGMADMAWAELLAHVGHDLRAPVASIIHYTTAELAAARLDMAQARVILAESQRALAALDRFMAHVRGQPAASHLAAARPRRAAQAQAQAQAQPPWLPREADAAAQAPRARGCVWVAEDCEIAAAALLGLLRDVGCEVLHFGDGQALMQRLADADAARPALVVMDFQMPGPDGPTVLYAVQARWPRLPVVCLTARDDTQALAAVGFAAVLSKPVTARALEPVLALLTPAFAGVDDATQAAPAATPCPEPAVLAELSALVRLGAISDLLERSGELATVRPDWQPWLSRLSALAGLGDLGGCLRLLHG